MPKIDINIAGHLTPDEKELFETLQKVVAEKSPNTTLRVAGGWVRDRMLGVPSDDIDIMVDNISGETFAKLVAEYIGLKDPHNILSNPEKSKHLSTSKMYIPLRSGKTQEVDFVQARKEIYHGDSRIPEIETFTEKPRKT